MASEKGGHSINVTLGIDVVPLLRPVCWFTLLLAVWETEDKAATERTNVSSIEPGAFIMKREIRQMLLIRSCVSHLPAHLDLLILRPVDQAIHDHAALAVLHFDDTSAMATGLVGLGGPVLCRHPIYLQRVIYSLPVILLGSYT